MHKTFRPWQLGQTSLLPPSPREWLSEEHQVYVLLERTITNTSQVPKALIADAGYWSEDNAKACEQRGVDPYIATGRLPHGRPPPPIFAPIPKDLDAIAEGFCEAVGRMARKLRMKKGQKIYARRKTIVEPVFGQTKEGRGLRRFLKQQRFQPAMATG
jgi:hypothetical protein